MKKKFDKSLLLPRFQAEIKEHLQGLNQGLLVLERDVKNKEVIDPMMRTTHTLKGSAVIAGFRRIADLAHKFEDALNNIKEGRLEVKSLVSEAEYA